MFEPAFYEINSEFDSNLTNYTKFEPLYDYLLRFVVDNWEAGTPDGSRFLDSTRAVSRVLAAVGDLSSYDVKSVTFQHVPAGQEVGFYNPSWYTIAMGQGFTDKFTSSDGTWTIDVVFRPKQSERAWTNVEKWTQVLQGQLVGSRGQPRVQCAGLINLDAGVGISDAVSGGVFTAAIIDWTGRQGFWQVTSSENPGSATGFTANEIQINRGAPGVAWNKASVGQVGQDGLGIAIGSALKPRALKPITIRDVQKPDGKEPGSGKKENVPIEIDPDTGLPKPPPAVSWQTLPTQSKVAAAAAGGLVMAGLIWVAGRLSR